MGENLSLGSMTKVELTHGSTEDLDQCNEKPVFTGDKNVS